MRAVHGQSYGGACHEAAQSIFDKDDGEISRLATKQHQRKEGISVSHAKLRTVLQNMRAGDLKWNGPRLGLVFILFLMN